MTVLRKLELFNFFSTHEATVKLDDPGLNLVVGKNGAGKSTLYAEGILYSLFGQSIEYGARPGMAVRNEHAKSRGFSTSVDFEQDGTQYRVIRSRGRGDWPDGVRLISGDTDLTGGTTEITQDTINKILGTTPKAFLSSVLFPSSLTRFPDLGDADRKAILDDLIQMSSFTKAHGETTKRISILLGEISLAVSERDAVVNKLASVNAIMSRTMQAQEEHGKMVREWLVSQTAIQDGIGVNERELLGLEAAKVRIEDDIAVLRQHQTSLSREHSVANAELATSKSTNSVVGSTLSDLESNLAKLSGKKRPDNCPTCGQAIPKDEAEQHLKDEVARLLEKINGVKSLAEVAKAEVSNKNQRVQSLEKDLRAIQSDVNSYGASLKGHGIRINEFIGVISGLKARIGSPPESPYTVELEKLKENTTEIEKDITEKETILRGKRLELENEETLKECFGPRGARSVILDAIVPWLNWKAEQVASLMGTHIRITFRIKDSGESNDGTMEVLCNNPVGSSKYRGSSYGEKRRANLICLMSLLELSTTRTGGNFQHCYFDESFENLDEEGIRGVTAVLRDLADRKTGVYVISHTTDVLGSVADRIITIGPGGVMS